MFSRRFKKIARLLKKKIDLSFLNPAGIVILAGMLVTAIYARKTIQTDFTEAKICNTTTSVHHDLTYIKPFTSLVGFNWKFGKENKKKTKEIKNAVFRLTFINL